MKLSIITVSYNSSSTIQDTIDSVLLQNYPDMEYIIIDGGSNDGTAQIIEKNKDRLTYYVSESDRGIYDAMNKGIAVAKGDIIGIINSDDWYEPGVFGDIARVFEKHIQVDVVYGDINVISANGEKRKKQHFPFHTLFYQMATPHPSVFVRSSIYKNLGVFDISYKIAGDFELMNRFWKEGVLFGFLNRTIANFRLGGVSTASKEQSDMEVSSIIDKYFDKSQFAEACFDTLLDKNEPTYVYGIGVWGKRVLNAFCESGYQVAGCYDSNKEKWGNESIQGIAIFDPSGIAEKNGQIVVAILRCNNVIEMISKANDKIKIIDLEECLEAYGRRIENTIRKAPIDCVLT